MLDLLAPRQCPGCAHELLPAEPFDFCEACATQLERADVPGSAYVHVGPVAEAIRRFKYAGRTELAVPLGRLAAEELLGLEHPVDRVLPVPLHASRRVERGYDQAALLAREVARHAGVRVALGLLVRRRPTGQQVGRRRHERLEAMRGAFVARPSVRGLRLVLVDDVRTTGATFDAAAAACLEAGAASVQTLSVSVASDEG